MEQSSPEDEMAQFFNDDDGIKEKLVSAEWTVDEYKGRLYGRIDCRFKEELTEDETEIFKDWLIGQCADGFIVIEYFQVKMQQKRRKRTLCCSAWAMIHALSRITQEELSE